MDSLQEIKTNQDILRLEFIPEKAIELCFDCIAFKDLYLCRKLNRIRDCVEEDIIWKVKDKGD